MHKDANPLTKDSDFLTYKNILLFLNMFLNILKIQIELKLSEMIQRTKTHLKKVFIFLSFLSYSFYLYFCI